MGADVRIFLSYSKYDLKFAESVSTRLKDDGHEVFDEKTSLKPGDNWLEKIHSSLSESEVILIVYSKPAQRSRWVQRELESIMLNDISNEEKKIITLSVDGAIPPGYLMNYQNVAFSNNDVENGYLALKSVLSDMKQFIRIGKIDYKTRNDSRIKDLKRSLKSGNLTMVCGAGVSIAANIPSWSDLLVQLLDAMMKKLSNNTNIPNKNINSIDFQQKLGSSLVIGKYLKSNLGKDFLTELRDALYRNDPKTCDLINAIVDISRPQRDGKPLDSIITFNFDALLEENMAQNNIKFKALYDEGIRNKAEELPIYHVHGYLPREGKLSPQNDVVLSEDAYHTQFIDPFSWANLIQLNKLSQNTCLFVGISLTDPNMRRLLDVSKRKEVEGSLNHYIIKKIPSLSSHKKKNSSSKKYRNDELMMFLEEQDANDLGLNVLWVEGFDEVPRLIKDLAQ